MILFLIATVKEHDITSTIAGAVHLVLIFFLIYKQRETDFIHNMAGGCTPPCDVVPNVQGGRGRG